MTNINKSTSKSLPKIETVVTGIVVAILRSRKGINSNAPHAVLVRFDGHWDTV